MQVLGQIRPPLWLVRTGSQGEYARKGVGHVCFWWVVVVVCSSLCDLTGPDLNHLMLGRGRDLQW